ncbi:hypothetical protein FSP39_024131 [Pinctada imbricata]|uniref:Cyclic GMP-AMP synthase n=1 Tax=Pinctada imbricata TaxID=66713 RepID=A0AA88XMW9_PINIB|nr:hypothetical protein FSP39_024131 [Pinctada imbricata]
MAASPESDEVSLISKGLYRIVSDEIGPECIVKLRRREEEIRNAFMNCDIYKNETFVLGGSSAEGFNFQSSDLDYMHIDRNAFVVTSTTHATKVRKSNKTILLMEADAVFPGYAFLKCLSYERNNENFKHSLVLRGDEVYVSSKLVRESFIFAGMSTSHGPCQTFDSMGFETDNAYTISCPDWPKQAMPFIKRSLDHGWPSQNVLTEICKDGCLFVPIQSKEQRFSDMNDLQWRISFALAEKKLMYTMNHCQFLCYGLTKVILNDILKKTLPSEDLLCSYYLKTAVFWEISENPSDWSASRFLCKFWNVFRRLLQWVSAGYCPNFFIPDNNMFYGKIFGETQQQLLGTLSDLYKEGYRYLLQCESINKPLSRLVRHPEKASTVSYDEEEYVPLSMIVDQQLSALFTFDAPFSETNDVKIIKLLVKTISMMERESADILPSLRLRVNHILQVYGQRLDFSDKTSRKNNGNRMRYREMITAESIFCRTKTFFCMNHFLSIQHMYMIGNYHRTIEMIHYTRRTLQSRPYTYKWDLDEDVITVASRQGLSHDKLIKSTIVDYVQMDEQASIDELKLECSLEGGNIAGVIYIPPIVFLNFLLILSYTRLDENDRRYDVLDELQALINQDDDHHIWTVNKAISWEILGISQQLCGDYEGAMESYVHSLADEYNNFEEATMTRMDSL